MLHILNSSTVLLKLDTFISSMEIFVLRVFCYFVGSDLTLKGSQVRCWPPLVAFKGRWE